jgi:pilus assembly protein Flp/PilA
MRSPAGVSANWSSESAKQSYLISGRLRQSDDAIESRLKERALLRTFVFTKRTDTMQPATMALMAFWSREDGLTTVEYAVAGGLVGVAIVAAFQVLGGTVGSLIANINVAVLAA